MCSAVTEQEISYYVSGGALPVIGNESYVFAGLVNPIFPKSGDTVTVNIAVQYLDQRMGMTQVPQFALQLGKINGSWENNLIVFAESNKYSDFDTNAENIIYFPKGNHSQDILHINKDNTTVYLE